MNFRTAGRLLNEGFSVIMLAMLGLSMALLLSRGFDATYFEGSHPAVPSFAYRIRTVVLYFALGFLASSRFDDFKGIPVALSCILIQHAAFEVFQHVTLFALIVGRTGFGIWVKDMALYAFMFSTSCYVVSEINPRQLLEPGPARTSLVVGLVILFLALILLIERWWPAIAGFKTLVIFPENIPIPELPPRDVVGVIYERFILFGVKFGLFQVTTALTMAFRRESS